MYVCERVCAYVCVWGRDGMCNARRTRTREHASCTPTRTRTGTSKANETRTINRKHRTSGWPLRPPSVKPSVSAIQGHIQSILLSGKPSSTAIPPTTHTCTRPTHNTTRRDATNIKNNQREKL